MILARRARLGAVGLVMAAASCTDAVAPSGDEVLPFITVKHAWRPGERDSLIARIIATRALALPYVGDISDLAPAMFADLDSVVVVVPNPAYHASVSSPFGAGAPAPAPGFAPSGAPGALTMPPAFDSTWIIQVIDVRVIDTRAPADTVPDIVGVFWAKKGEETWHGFTLADRCRSIGGAGRNTCMNNRPATTKSGGYVNINTTQFDASGDTVGAGGGEYRQTTGEYWEANGGKFEVKSAAYGGAFTVTTGPFLGGTMATGTGQGDLVGVTMPRLLPSANAGFTVSLDFRATAVAATRLTCIFPSPCTTNVPGIAAAARRGALPEQLRTQLPWVAARRNAAALRH